MRADAPLSSRSAAYSAWLNALIAAKGAWLNTTSCGMPQYWASPSTLKVPVILDHPSYMDPVLINAWSAVPIPPEAQPAACSDKNFSVAQVQPDRTVRSWEFWAATQRADGSWLAKWGGATQDVALDRGIASTLAWKDLTAPIWTGGTSNAWWNVAASSISHDAGVIRQAEFAAQRVDHALALALPAIAKDRFMWPAQRTDGGSLEADAIPEGARLRLDPALDVEALQVTPLVKLLARAAQKYGAVVRDGSGDVTVIYGEPPAAGRPDAATPLLNGSPLAAALSTFPWSRLQVLDAPECTSTPCVAPNKARISIDGPAPQVGTSTTLDTSNSLLDQPRTRVEWDLDGNGSFETFGGKPGIRIGWTPRTVGPMTLRVRIITRDGKWTTGTQPVTVAPVPVA